MVPDLVSNTIRSQDAFWSVAKLLAEDVTAAFVDHRYLTNKVTLLGSTGVLLLNSPP